MRNELGRLAELGAWETRNEVIKNISNTRANIHDEEVFFYIFFHLKPRKNALMIY